MASITLFRPHARLGEPFAAHGVWHSVVLSDVNPGEVELIVPADRRHAIVAALNGAAAVDLNNIPALRNFIRDNAARAGLGVFEREVME